MAEMLAVFLRGMGWTGDYRKIDPDAPAIDTAILSGEPVTPTVLPTDDVSPSN